MILLGGGGCDLVALLAAANRTLAVDLVLILKVFVSNISLLGQGVALGNVIGIGAHGRSQTLRNRKNENTNRTKK